MPFTREQYDALLEAIASGASTLSYGGKNIAYRSVDDMIRTARLMQSQLGIAKENYSSNFQYRNPRVSRR